MMHLKAKKDDMVFRVQTCIAQASKYQLDQSVHLPQLDVLTLVLDLACSLQQKTPQLALQKLKALQTRMDELIQSPEWDATQQEMLLPFKKHLASSSCISEDTRAIVRPGGGELDLLVLTFVTKIQAFALA
jgi:hypothetical protein